MRNVLLLGGSGFIGSAVAEMLTKRGDFVTVPTRDRERARQLLLLPTCDVVSANIHDPATLDRLVRTHDVVINLIGTLHGDFEQVHVVLAAEVAEACAKHHVARLIQMSALGADVNAPSQYLQSRARGESRVRDVADRTGLAVTLFRPSVVYGEHDRFLNMFANLVKWFPLIPLGSPGATFQVVWVEDVARAMVLAVDLPETIGKTYALVGPKVYTLRQLIEFVIAQSGKRRVVLGLGPTLSRWQATLFEFLPGKILTRDNVLSMQVPNTSSESYPVVFGHAAQMEDIVGDYLHQAACGRARYQRLRERAAASDSHLPPAK